MEATTITPAGLVYLFADRLVPAKSGRLDQGVPVPGSDTQASARALAETVSAIALWNLYRQGAVTLRMEDKKGLLRSKRILQISPLTDGGSGGIEGSFMQVIPSGGAKAAQVVTRGLGRSSANPWGEVIRRAVAEAVAAGAGDVDSGRKAGLKAALGGIPQFVLAPAGRAPFEPAGERLIAEWQAFSAAEPELHAELLAACKAGIAAGEDS